MEKEIIKEKLREILISVLEHDHFQMTDDLKAGEVEGWNSLAQAMIVTAIESEFGIKLKLRDLNNWKDLGSLITILKEKLKDETSV